MDETITIGPELKRRRELAGMSVRELAIAAGCRAATVYQIETGGSGGTVRIASVLARALGCTIDDLLPARAVEAEACACQK